MPRIVKSARGKTIDMQALTRGNEDMIAVSPHGAHNMTARGDIVGPRGRIVSRAEDRDRAYDRAYNETNEKSAKNVSIKADNLLGLDSNANQPKPVRPQTQVGSMTQANQPLDQIETLELEDIASVFAQPKTIIAEEDIEKAEKDNIESINTGKRRRRTTTKG